MAIIPGVMHVSNDHLLGYDLLGGTHAASRDLLFIEVTSRSLQ